jgi:uncharacterized protein YutE (UPF0331/DUF86 family)
MDLEVVEQKLESLRRCLQRIESKCPADAQTLAADFDLQDIVSLNLKKAVGFRNIAVHNFDAINWHHCPQHCGEPLGRLLNVCKSSGP